MTGGLRFTFTGNWAGDGFPTSWTGSWRATGERGSVIWEDEGAPASSSAPGHRIEAVAPAPLDRSPARFPGLEFSLAEFVDALRTGRLPAGECHDNFRSLAMCQRGRVGAHRPAWPSSTSLAAEAVRASQASWSVAWVATRAGWWR